MSTANEVNIIDDKNKKVSLLYYLKTKKPESRNSAVEKLSRENKLKNFELEPLQLISFLSLFVTHGRYSAFENLMPLFANPELTELKNFKLKPARLKAILLMFDSDRLKVLNLLKKTFDIKIHLTPLDTNDLETCLERDPEFKKLLPLNKKKIWDSFFVKDEGRPNPQPIPYKIVTISANKPKNPRCNMPLSPRQRENKILSREVGVPREAGNAFHSKFVMKKDKNSIKFVDDTKHNDSHSIKQTNFLNKTTEIFKQRDSFNSNNSLQKRDIKNKSLELLSIKIMQCQSRGRFDFFKNYVKAQKQSIVFENAEGFYKFIKVFSPHDAIKLLDLPYIKDQIKNLQQQKSYLSVKDYTDLLKDIDEKLLKPISPKVKSRIDAVPDLILNCKR